MNEIVKEYDIKNINQNIRNNGYRFVDNEALETTKPLNQIIVLVANK
jgi:hypothetical protein